MLTRLVAGLVMAALLLAGCTNPKHQQDEHDQTQLPAGTDSVHYTGYDLGWLSARFPADAQASLVVEVDYGGQTGWPYETLIIVGADVEGQIQDADICMAASATSSESTTAPAWFRFAAAGQSREAETPTSLPHLVPDQARSTYPPIYRLELDEQCSGVVKPGGMWRIVVILSGADPTAPFQIWANSTKGVEVRYGFGNDTFRFDTRDFESVQSLAYSAGGVDGVIATDLGLEIPLGQPGDRVVFGFRGVTKAGSLFAAPNVGDATYRTPDGSTRSVSQGFAMENGAGGNWTFNMDSRSGPAREAQAVLWGAVMRSSSMGD